MKKIYTLCMGILCISQINAQFKAGQKLVGPSLGIGFSTDDRETNTMNNTSVNNRNTNAFSIAIGVSSIKMKNERTGLGFGLTYGFDNNKISDKSTSTYEYSFNRHTVGASVFKRKFIPIKGKWNFYYDAGLNASISTAKSITTYSNIAGSTTDKGNAYRAGLFLTPGITYQLKNNLILEGAFTNIFSGGYTLENSNSENTNGDKFKNKRSFANINSTLNANDFFRNITISLRWMM